MESEMKITKFDHSGFLLEKAGRGLLFDPVEYDNPLPKMTNLDAIIVTHRHGDHFQPEVLQKIREANPEAKLFATADNEELRGVAAIALDGDRISVGIFELTFYGGNHAEIIPGQFVCQNIGVLVDGVFANSGDSFDLPLAQPEVLAAPVAAPWLKLAETKYFIEAVRPKVVIPAHDALNSGLGNAVCDNWLRKICDDIGAEYRNIHFGEIQP